MFAASDMCDTGWPVEYRSNYDSSGFTMVSQKEFSCYGKITHWSWYVYSSNRPFRAIVWRRESGSSTRYKIMGINDLQSSSTGRTSYTVPEDEQIFVKPGDVIGWSYSHSYSLRYSGSRYSYTEDLIRYVGGNLASSLQVNQVVDINSGSEYRKYSIWADVDECKWCYSCKLYKMTYPS